jgi:hypothetical protein
LNAPERVKDIGKYIWDLLNIGSPGEIWSGNIFISQFIWKNSFIMK